MSSPTPASSTPATVAVTESTPVPAAPATPKRSAPKPRLNPTQAGTRSLAALLLAPTIVGIVIFTALPILASLVLAFFRWDLISAPRFVGVDNFTSIVTDSTVRVSFLNTFLFVIVAVSLQMVIALTLAALVQTRMPSWLRVFFRSAFFFPLILSSASVSILMKYLFNEQFGVVNWMLSLIGIPAVPWLTAPQAAMAVIVIVYVWQSFGFTFLLFLGGISGVPRDVYEAASIDGATGWRQFRTITIPLISPTILVASVMAIISALQVFDQPYVLTKGGPGNATRTAVMVIYESAFRNLEFGRASAIGLILMLIIMAATYAQFRLSKRFVFYQ